MLTPEDFKTIDGIEWKESLKLHAQQEKKFQAFLDYCTIAACLGVGLPPECVYRGDAIYTFDAATRDGFKLDLVTGKYYVPR